MAKTQNSRNKKPLPPSKTQIAAILREAAFDPRASGPLSIIADVGDAAYYQARAAESIGLSRHSGLDRAELVKAMRLLALAINRIDTINAEPSEDA